MGPFRSCLDSLCRGGWTGAGHFRSGLRRCPSRLSARAASVHISVPWHPLSLRQERPPPPPVTQRSAHMSPLWESFPSPTGEELVTFFSEGPGTSHQPHSGPKGGLTAAVCLLPSRDGHLRRQGPWVPCPCLAHLGTRQVYGAEGKEAQWLRNEDVQEPAGERRERGAEEKYSGDEEPGLSLRRPLIAGSAQTTPHRLRSCPHRLAQETQGSRDGIRLCCGLSRIQRRIQGGRQAFQ